MHTDHTSSQRHQPSKDLQKFCFTKTPKRFTNDDDDADFAYDDNDNANDEDVRLLLFSGNLCLVALVDDNDIGDDMTLSMMMIAFPANLCLVALSRLVTFLDSG